LIWWKKTEGKRWDKDKEKGKQKKKQTELSQRKLV